MDVPRICDSPKAVPHKLATRTPTGIGIAVGPYSKNMKAVVK